MLRFSTEEFAQAFERVVWISLPLGGKLVRVPFSTSRYEDARHAFLLQCPAPKRQPIKHRVVSPDSADGRELGLTSAAHLEVYAPEDFAFSAQRAAHGAMFGRYLAAYCLNVELEADGAVLDTTKRVEFFKRHMQDQAANDLVGRLSAAVALEVRDGADFFGESSVSVGDSGPQSQEA